MRTDSHMLWRNVARAALTDGGMAGEAVTLTGGARLATASLAGDGGHERSWPSTRQATAVAVKGRLAHSCRRNPGGHRRTGGVEFERQPCREYSMGVLGYCDVRVHARAGETR